MAVPYFVYDGQTSDRDAAWEKLLPEILQGTSK